MNISFIIIIIISLLLGLLIVSKPDQMISIQQKFYLLINWRMEPVSYPKEIRNTRLMGLFLILATLIACIYYLLR